MIKLEPDKSQLWLEYGETDRKWEKIQKRIQDHPFNHAVEVFVPGVADLPSNLCTLSPPVYFTSQLRLSQFIQPHLRQTIRSQSLSALTVDARVDTDNVYALLPSGKLMLSVDKDTYEQLGVVGKPSRFQKQHRFLVEVDLMADHFRPSKPNYDRVKWCLEERLGGDVHFVLCHSPTGGTINRELLTTPHECVLDQQLLLNLQLPTPDGHRPHGKSTSCSATELHTWLGALSCGVEVHGEILEDYVSTYQTPEPHTTCQYGMRVRWTGMIHSDWICDLLHRARSVLADSDTEKDVGWIAVTVWGFEDAPISWYGCEHGSFTWGDNHYVVILFRDGHYWTMTSLGSHDVMR